MPEIITIRCANLFFSDRILQINFFDGAEIVLEDVKKIFLIGLEMANGNPYCTLSDARNTSGSTKEARAFGSTEGYTKYRLADALLVNSLGMKLIANSYIRFNQPHVPTKIFNKKDQAKIWLETFLT